MGITWENTGKMLIEWDGLNSVDIRLVKVDSMKHRDLSLRSCNDWKIP